MQFITEGHGVRTIDQAQGGTLSIGNKLKLIPSHVCPVINLFDSAYGTRRGEVVQELVAAGRDKVR
jgi:D-serine deaminase-like pyridoxal phosphate-dependent protein